MSPRVRNCARETFRRWRPKPLFGPGATNLQPWAFAVFHGQKRLRNYSEWAKLHLVATNPTTFELHSRSEFYEYPSYDLFHGVNHGFGERHALGNPLLDEVDEND